MPRPACITLLGSAALTAAAAAQADAYRWQGHMLHQEGVYRSEATALDGSRACGDMDGDGAIWPGTTPDYISLMPAGAIRSFVWGADGGVQGGEAGWSLQEIYPALWRGSAESFENLVGPYLDGGVQAVTGNQLVGIGYSPSDGLPRAVLWPADHPEQFVELHPEWGDWSEAWATDGVWQGGRIASTDLGGIHVGIWKGTPETWVRFAGPVVGGNVFGMAPGTQVGYLAGGTHRAMVWHDTPESAVSLHPPGASSSRLHATTGNWHVGYAVRPKAHARIWWSDEPEDHLDLHEFVPAEHQADGSVANDISVVDGVIYIAGSVNAPRAMAFLWIGTPIDSTDHDTGKRPRTTQPRP